MTVRSDRLDLTLSAHLMGDGSGSHCRMMSESPRKFNIFTAHTVANVSVGTCRTQMFSHKHEIVTLYYWEFAVFDDALCSFVVPLVLCL